MLKLVKADSAVSTKALTVIVNSVRGGHQPQTLEDRGIKDGFLARLALELGDYS